MMIVTILSLLVAQEKLPDAGAVISKMIARYNSAQRIAGDFSSTVTVGQNQVSISSKIQIERPNRIFLSQTVQPGGATYRLVSDGKQFSYGKPVESPNTDSHEGSRLFEDVRGDTKLGDIVRAAAHSIAERSAVLDILVSDLGDLKFLRGQWKTLENTGMVDLNGEQVYRIVGQWRAQSHLDSTSNYGMYISDAGDLRKYVIDGNFAVESDVPTPTPEKIRVTREFVLNVKVDAELVPTLFEVGKS